jgi:endoglucanase
MKNILFSFYFLICSTLIICSCNNQGVNKQSALKTDSACEKFIIKKGINISYWLSQIEGNSSINSSFFTEKDVEFIAQLGYDHIRLPLDEETLFSKAGEKKKEAIQLLHNAIKWCIKFKLKVIVDLHQTYSHNFNNKKNPLWKSEAEKEHFIKLWSVLSEELKNYPEKVVAYELLNEPTTPLSSQWNDLFARALAAIRKTEPNRIIIIGSTLWQSPSTLNELIIPENEKNIILSFHFYAPMILTHYKASWMPFAEFKGMVNYPGQTVDSIELVGYSKKIRNEIIQYNGYYIQDTLKKLIQYAIDFSRKNGLRLYCGEFGCLPTVHRLARLQWYKDVREIFEDNNIAWANWDYKGAFAIYNNATGNPDSKLIEVLLGKQNN